MSDESSGNMPRQWNGVFNNYTAEAVESFRQWCLKNTTFSSAGYEIAPTTGTPHLQSFHQMRGTPKFKAFKKLFPAISVHPVKKDNGCTAYTAKEDNIAFTTGTYIDKTPGRRTDLEHVAKKIKTGATMKEIADENPIAVMQYGQGIQRLLSIYEKPRDRNIPKIVVCLYGPTEVHKTRRIFDKVEGLGQELYVWDTDVSTQWWCGYAGHKYVLMDEFRGQLPRGRLLRLLDRYPTRVQYKGGSTQFVADYIYITSPIHPEEWYQDLGEDKKEQFLRRFYMIEKITSKTQSVLLPPIAV